MNQLLEQIDEVFNEMHTGIVWNISKYLDSLSEDQLLEQIEYYRKHTEKQEKLLSLMEGLSYKKFNNQKGDGKR